MTDSDRQSVPSESIDSDTASSSAPTTPLQDETPPDHDEFAQDVAVIGMACRLAGGVDSPEDLWRAMLEKKDFSGEIPSMRWEPYHARDVRNTKELSKTTTRGYFLDAIEDFDAAFFGISPKEAEQMDPQQRLSLEVSWEALENAGIPPQNLSQSDTAVFMGVNSDDYSKLLLEDLPGIEAWMGIGTAFCGVPNRISYHMDLMGPSTAVDAACASSLVAIHHGRQAILLGESKIAIAGGCNSLGGPGLTRVLDEAGAVSHDGSCMSFDDDAHGYGRGEGAAVVILKGMADAVADGDNIIAVLKGSAVAQDGHTNGIMAPNGKAQELVARKALKVAGLEASRIQYVEAHATSTPLGDPTEVGAISNVYGSGRSPKNPVLVGSVKPNVGHLEGGAGAVGFIKAALSINKGILPPQANLKKLNTKIDWKESGVKVVQEPTVWPGRDDNRCAAICSYGYGGTVAHAVIEGYSKRGKHLSTQAKEGDEASPFPDILLMSAPQERRMAVQAAEQAAWISSGGKEHNLRTIATTLALRRGHHGYRAALVVDNHEDAVKSLSTFANGSANEWTAQDRVLDSGVNKGIVWVFSGHGAQWKEMGRDLLNDPLFRQAVAALDHIVESEMGFSAIQALEGGDFDDSDKVQVLTYIMQIGLSAVLRARGLKPQAVIGHSVGELAASVAAGALTAEEGALIVCKRAVLYRQVMGLGSMILVNSPCLEIESELAGREDIVAAIDSSPSSCVVSGEASAVAEFDQSLKARGITTFKVKTDVAFHSPMLKKLVSPLQAALAESLHPRSPKIKLYSSSDSDPRTEGLRDIKYWTSNMINPVLLKSAVNAAAEDGLRLFLEVSSHPIVSQSISETLMDKGIEDFSVIPTMERRKPARKSIQLSIAQLYCRGADIQWKKQMGRNWAQSVPGTHWSHKPFWKVIENGPLGGSAVHDVEKHNLLGQGIPVAGTNTFVYTTQLDSNTKPFPGTHPLHGTEIVPAAVLVNTFLSATGAKSLSNIILRVPVAVSAQRDVQIVVQQDQIKISSTLTQDKGTQPDKASWVTHTTGSWSPETSVADDHQKLNISAIQARIGTKLADNFSIEYLDKVGVSAMGFPWAVTEHYGNLKEMVARVDAAPDTAAAEDLPWESHSWAPLLDAATSVGSTLFFNEPKLRMPAQIDRVEVYTDSLPPKTGYLYVEEAPNAGLAVDVCILDESGEPLLKVFSMRFSEIEGTGGASTSTESLVHQVAWPPTAFSEKPLEISNVILISGHSPTESFIANLSDKFASVIKLSQAQDLSKADLSEPLKSKETVIVYCPGQVESIDDILKASELFISELLHIVKFVAQSSLPTKVFVLTDKTFASKDLTALAQAPLHGLCRIIASELPDLWGALIDTEDSSFPFLAIKYVQGQDVIRMSDGVPRTARLRPFPREITSKGVNLNSLLPRPEGTYIITGGIGALGLEVADFLVEKGARRLVLVSRRELPPRGDWENLDGSIKNAAQKIKHLENLGATIHVVAADIGAPLGSEDLNNALNALSLPPTLGVVHAAGVLEDQLVLETTADSFDRVLRPKIAGALALHSLFPPGSLDFFVLFSSCGQLFGFPGQSSYASGNAFLDTLATHRRNMGDNAIAFQWTSWRGLGMAASTDFINAELESKGITDITRDEAFRAWEHVAKYDTDHAVVLRSLAFDENEPLPVPILNDIAVRRAGTAAAGAAPAAEGAGSDSTTNMSGPELKAHLDAKIRECVMSVLQLSSIDDVDSRAALADLGVDSVMTVTLRKKLQSSLKVKVPPTLTWSHPTVGHLVGWYIEKLGPGSV